MRDEIERVNHRHEDRQRDQHDLEPINEEAKDRNDLAACHSNSSSGTLSVGDAGCRLTVGLELQKKGPSPDLAETRRAELGHAAVRPRGRARPRPLEAAGRQKSAPQ